MPIWNGRAGSSGSDWSSVAPSDRSQPPGVTVSCGAIRRVYQPVPPSRRAARGEAFGSTAPPDASHHELAHTRIHVRAPLRPGTRALTRRKHAVVDLRAAAAA